jgi:hypothetical protein
MYDIFYVSSGEINPENWIEIKQKYPRAKKIENVNAYEDILKKSFTKMFWVIWDDVILEPNFDLDAYTVTKWDDMYIHVFRNGDTWDGITLFSKAATVSDREFKNRYYITKKEIEVVASRPQKYPQYRISTYDEYLEILKTVKHDLFWCIWPELTIINDTVFQMYFSRHNNYDTRENHSFLNIQGDEISYENGVCLLSKHKQISNREFNRRYLIDKKEHITDPVSRLSYSVYNITSYEQYIEIMKTEKHPMFWCLWDNIEVIDHSIFNLYYSLKRGDFDYDRSENHIWLNGCGNDSSHLNGLMLFSTKKQISQREFDRRYLIDKKQHDEIVTRYRYPRYNISTYSEYQEIVKTCPQPMFWCIWDNIEIIDDTIFDFYFDPKDGKWDHDRAENHMFKNLCNDAASYFNGLVLCSTQKEISQREFDRRYLIDKKEHDRVPSRYRYPRYTVTSYQHYLEICSTEKQSMFWCIWPEIEITNESVFDLYFDPLDGKYDYDRSITHVFKHLIRQDEIYNGLMLVPTNKALSEKEIEFRFPIDKKEHSILVSCAKPYDIVFISYNEANADQTYKTLQARFPKIKRVHGITGIHQAHIAAAKLATTDMFWVVDGDAEITRSFKFEYTVSRHERDIVHVWRSRNPINDLIYGYGGVKLLPRKMTIEMDVNSPDMTTSISKRFKSVPEISNITAFNTDPYNTWKSAFRECVKLSSRVIERQDNTETLERLDIWCTKGADRPYGEYAIAGAIAGKQYGEDNKNIPVMLKQINDFDWLKKQYDIFEQRKG